MYIKNWLSDSSPKKKQKKNYKFKYAKKLNNLLFSINL